MGYTVSMQNVIVASNNPIKIQAARTAFEKMFPGQTFAVKGVQAPSDVKDQPDSEEETYQGAVNRATNARALAPQADFWVGLEGGIEQRGDEMASLGWMVVLDNNGKMGKARTGLFFLPPKVAQLIREGKELGEADDIVFGKTNSKQANGAVGLLTHDLITRSGYYEEAIILALIPFKNEVLYS